MAADDPSQAALASQAGRATSAAAPSSTLRRAWSSAGASAGLPHAAQFAPRPAVLHTYLTKRCKSSPKTM